ncbi:ketopantoate reductase family protein [Terrarubrum flagellatum]|uniref:ketopantoate reductase family protein n=1 Tax=Terrirubrum flagellatum TaxID=2895980 RepID=UPI00314553DC
MADVVIWGSGAIGGTIGAYLARAGREVLFVDIEQAHVDAINSGRLAIEGPIDAFSVGGAAKTPDGVKGAFPLILLAVKAHHTEAATRSLAPHLAENGAVVSCQNGLNELVIADIVGRGRTIGAFVNFMADYLEPGRIAYGGRGAVVVGELHGALSERLQSLHDLLRIFEPDAIQTDNIFGYLWGKAAYGLILKASAVADESIIGFIANPEWRASTIAMIQEVLRAAEAAGVIPLGFNGFDPAAFSNGHAAAIDSSMQALIAYNSKAAKSHSGVWRDIVVRRRHTDVAAQLAPVQKAAREHGVATPKVDRLVAMIKEIETGSRSVGAEFYREILAS